MQYIYIYISDKWNISDKLLAGRIRIMEITNLRKDLTFILGAKTENSGNDIIRREWGKSQENKAIP